MNRLAGICCVIGLFLGLVTIFSNDGALACIISIVAMIGSALLLQMAQRQGVAAPKNHESYTAG